MEQKLKTLNMHFTPGTAKDKAKVIFLNHSAFLCEIKLN